MFSQSDCIFAVLRMQAQRSFQKPCFSWFDTDIHRKACPELLRTSFWDPFGQARSVQNRSGSDLEWHQLLDLDFKGWARSGRRALCTLDPGPWYPVIYILESRARFARAQFSYLDVEARRPCWGVVRSRSGTPTPFAGYTFLYTSASGNKEHTEHLPQCLDASIPCLLKNNPS